MIGYLQHGAGTNGPFCTEAVTVRHDYRDMYSARFEGRWRRVHDNNRESWIIYRGKRIKILIDGVTPC